MANPGADMSKFTVKPVKNPRLRPAFKKLFPFCAACGLTEYQALSRYFPHSLECHHIVKPGHSDERCNFLTLCQRCHMLAEGHTIRVDGVVLPKLSLANCLWLKKQVDPEYYDETRLTQLYRRKTLPELEEPQRS